MKPKSISEALRLPVFQITSTLQCPVKCTYCSLYSTNTSNESVFADDATFRMLADFPQTMFLISGGEPLSDPLLVRFCEFLAASDHWAIIVTSGVTSRKLLRECMEALKENRNILFMITHHILEGVNLRYLLDRLDILKWYGVQHIINYLAIPDLRGEISDNLSILRKKNTPCNLLPFISFNGRAYKGRFFPVDYKFDDFVWILENNYIKNALIQFFGGMQTKGAVCRAGVESAVFNALGDRAINPCCHLSNVSIDRSETVFGSNETLSYFHCPGTTYCFQYPLVMCNRACLSDYDTVSPECTGVRESIAFLKQISDEYPFLYQEKFDEYRLLVES